MGSCDGYVHVEVPIENRGGDGGAPRTAVRGSQTCGLTAGASRISSIRRRTSGIWLVPPIRRMASRCSGLIRRSASAGAQRFGAVRDKVVDPGLEFIALDLDRPGEIRRGHDREILSREHDLGPLNVAAELRPLGFGPLRACSRDSEAIFPSARPVQVRRAPDSPGGLFFEESVFISQDGHVDCSAPPIEHQDPSGCADIIAVGDRRGGRLIQ